MAEDIIENEEAPVPEEPEVYTLVVTTTPAEATVTIEGHTPEVNGAKKTFTLDSQGTVSAEVTLEGYISQTKWINVNSTTKSVSVTLDAEPEVYTLVVTTSPAGATATIEGYTPEVNGAKKTFTFSEQDIVSVEVSLEGYVSQKKEIEIDSSKTTTITLKAVPTYDVVITTTPAEATVSIDGVEPVVDGAKKTFTFSEQSKVTAEVSLEGYVTKTQEIDVDNMSISIELDKEESKEEEENPEGVSYVAVWQILRGGTYIKGGENIDSEDFKDDIDRLLEIGAIREV